MVEFLLSFYLLINIVRYIYCVCLKGLDKGTTNGKHGQIKPLFFEKKPHGMGGLIPSDRFLVEKSGFHSMDKSAFVSGTDGVCSMYTWRLYRERSATFLTVNGILR